MERRRVIRVAIVFAAAAGATAVALGAWLAHGAGLTPAAAAQARTALDYQFWHVLALLGAALVGDRWPGRVATMAAALFMGGMLLFCGGLYLLALRGLPWGAHLAPIGGLLLIAGWLALAWHGFIAIRRS
jgi:uncharacterized membrane protein YgdD (TMEM256/DUF423 family)